MDKLIAQISEKIWKEYRPEKIILFGSRAWGKPRRDSDIDLFIIKRTRKRHIDRSVAVSEILDEEHKSLSFDLMVYTPQEVARRIKINDPFVKKIVEKGLVLHG
jgi:predicted nucleotidyltransferase